MKVLQINSVCGIGSTGRICTDLADILLSNGHDCQIAYGRKAAPEFFEKYGFRIGTDWDVRFDGLQTRIFDKAGFFSHRPTKQLIDRIEAYKPDVIHLHNLHGYYINVEILFNYLKKINKPVIWTLHDCWTFTGHCAHFDFIKCDSWKSGCSNCPQKGEYPASLFLDQSRLNYDAKKKLFNSVNDITIVTPSKWLAQIVQQSFLSKYPIKIIPNGIDLNVFKKTSSNFRQNYNLEDKFVILGVANGWGPKKGLDSFIQLASMLNDNYRIILVGVNKSLIRGLPAKIIGIERTNNAVELAEIYTAANVFVNPTLEEVLGMVNIEAMACGLPVITYNTGGSPESLFETSGYVVEKGNISSMFEKIVQLSHEKKIHDVNYHHVMKFSKIAMADAYLKIYTRNT